MERPSYWKTTLDEQTEILNTVKKGHVRSIAKSAGNRDVLMVEYGEKQDFRKTANYSSACGAGNTKYFADKAGKKPVIFIIGAAHAGELEGTAAVFNLIKMIETGEDFRGYKNPYLSDCINHCRLLIIPLSNPDGRARMTPPAAMYGMSYDELRHYGQGRWKDGTLCEYPQCKSVHPIKDHVSFLGTYYNDDGVNMMHDNFFGPMAKETQVLFDIAGNEAPDFTLMLHGGGNTKNSILNTTFVPLFVKQKIRILSLRIKEEAGKANLEFIEPKIQHDDSFPPPSFNLASALHHASGTLPVLYESNQGLCYDRELKNWETVLSFEQILTHHYILFGETVKYALELSCLE